VVEDVVQGAARTYLHKDDEEGAKNLVDWVNAMFPIGLRREDLPAHDQLTAEQAATVTIMDRSSKAYELKAQHEDPEQLKPMERFLMLRRSTPTGRNTCAAWTPCARGWACGPTASATRWSSTSARRSRCSPT
jgi:hypothetical protein